MARFLIAGGTGLIGSEIEKKCLELGHEVRILTRTPRKDNHYRWSLKENWADPKAFEGIDHILNLTGSGIADKRWTKQRKKVLLASRINPITLLYKTLFENDIKVQSFVSASGTGYYGYSNDRNTIFTEKSPLGTHFLSEICSDWEEAALQLESLTRTVILRTGVVFSKKGGAFPKMVQPFQFKLGVNFGTYDPIIPWISLHDIADMYIQTAIHPQFEGVYNAVTGNIDMSSINNQLAKQFKAFVFPLPLPEFLLQLGLGKRADLVLKGNTVNFDKITQAGFTPTQATFTNWLKEEY